MKHILGQHKEDKKKKTPSNWMAEIEVPLGMKYVLSRVFDIKTIIISIQLGIFYLFKTQEKVELYQNIGVFSGQYFSLLAFTIQSMSFQIMQRNISIIPLIFDALHRPVS